MVGFFCPIVALSTPLCTGEVHTAPSVRPTFVGGPFPDSEWVYKVYWEKAVMGSSLNIAEVRFQMGRYCPYEPRDSRYCASLGLRTRGLISWVYKVRDEWMTCMDAHALVPVLFHRTLREGKYRKYEYTSFAENRTQVSVRAAKTRTDALQSTPKRYAIPPNTQDFLSGLLVFLHQWQAGHPPPATTSIPIFLGDSVFDTSIRYQGQENISHAYYGTTQTYVFAPSVTSFSTFAHQNPITLWVSADARRVPLRVHLQLKWGVFRVELVHIRPAPAQTKKKK